MSALVLWLALAQLPEAKSGVHLEAAAGAPIAHFLPWGDAKDAEHLVTGAQSQAIAAGWGFVFQHLRLDVGARVSRLRLQVVGAYDEARRRDDFEAGYEYLGFLVEALASTRLGGRVDPQLGFAMGPGLFISDRRGGQPQLEVLKVYGTFTFGALVHVTAWLDLRASLQWLPQFVNLNVVTPELGLRIRL